MRGLFITGTGTCVGKTVVAAALLHRYRGTFPLCYWKPIQTGIEQSHDTAVVCELGQCSDSEIFDRGIRLRHSVSPHLAARLAGEEINLDSLTEMVVGIPRASCLLVEGAGGVLVPVNDRHMMTDLMEKLALAILVVAHPTLGTINHTLMTLETLRRRSLRIAGVVIVGDADLENRGAIERFGHVDVVGELPLFQPLTAENLRSWATAELDPMGVLRGSFR